MLFKQEVTRGVVTPYISAYTTNTFSLINPLAALSLVFKPKSYFNTSLRARSKYNFCAGSLYSTSSKPKSRSDDFFQKVYSDKSAHNPFFIVNNFFKQYPNPDLAKANIDYKLVKRILGNHIKDFKLSKEAFDLLMKQTGDQPLKFDELPLSREGKAYFQSVLGVTKRGVNNKAGVYFFINKITGEGYVGSSGALASRLKDDYLRKGKILGKRPIELAIKKYGLSNFRLEVYVLSQELLNKIYPELHSSVGELERILPKSQVKGVTCAGVDVDILNLSEFKKEIRNFVLVLEQICILLLNPKYNQLKVAGSAAGNKIQKELMVSVFEKSRKITYMYDMEKKELIYKAMSRTLLAESLGMKRRFVLKQLYLNRFFISDELLSEKEYSNNLLSSEALTALIDGIRDQIMEKTSRNFLPFKEIVRAKLSKSTELINTVTKEEKVFPSLNAVALYLRELNPEYKASAGSLHNIMKRGGLYKGIFLVRYVVKNEDPSAPKE